MVFSREETAPNPILVYIASFRNDTFLWYSSLFHVEGMVMSYNSVLGVPGTPIWYAFVYRYDIMLANKDTFKVIDTISRNATNTTRTDNRGCGQFFPDSFIYYHTGSLERCGVH